MTLRAITGNPRSSSSFEAAADLVHEVDPGLRLRAGDEPRGRFALKHGADRPANRRGCDLESFSGPDRARWVRIYRKLLSGEAARHTERSPLRPSSRPRLDPDGRVDGLVRRPRDIDEGRARLADLPHGRARGGRLYNPGTGGAIRLAGFLCPLCGEGGDLIWDRRLDDGSRDIVLADVMGHNAVSARVARAIRSILDGLPADHPGDSVRMLNEELLRVLPGIYPETMFATGLYIQVDAASRKLRVSNFAHFGLLSSERGEIDPPGGLPVGIFPSEDPWPEVELDFGELGRRVLAYTDGIVEQHDPSGAMLGRPGLLHEFRGSLGVDLDAGLARIMSGVDDFRGGAPVKDDQSLLAVELS